VKELKRVSNSWVQEQSSDFRNFQWQGGYADFSVSAGDLDAVRTYITRQEEHHREVTFQDELRDLLRKHNLEWDERYVWE